MALIVLLISAVVMDALLDIRGGPTSKLGTPKYIPINWQHKLGKPYDFPDGYSASLNRPAPTSAVGTEFEKIPEDKPAGHSLPAPTSAYGTEFEEIPGETGKPAGHSLPAPTSAYGTEFEDIPGDGEKPAGHSLPAPTSAYGTEFENIPEDGDKPAGHSLPAPTSAYGTEPTNIIPIPAQGLDAIGGTLEDLVAKVQQAGKDGVVIINDIAGDIKAEVHDEDVHGPAHKAAKWEDLSKKQKSLWRKKLSDAGHWAEEWAEDTGNAIWKGVVFSEIAGAIGQAVAG